MALVRTLLILSRPSYLPTVWSNVIAGWWLGGGARIRLLPYALIGCSLLYLGGAFLNDAFDTNFDRQHRRNYPIPCGLMPRVLTFQLGFIWLLSGVGVLFVADWTSGVLGAALGLWIVGYSASHRALVVSPLVLGVCRLFVYLIGASTAGSGVTGWSIWAGLAVSLYVTGVAGLFPPAEPGRGRRWLLLLLGTPVCLAFVMNGEEYREGALLLASVLALWCLRCLRHSFWSPNPDHALTVSGLFAGVVLVDWLAVVDAPKYLSFVFIALFLVALGLQRFSPGRRVRTA